MSKIRDIKGIESDMGTSVLKLYTPDTYCKWYYVGLEVAGKRIANLYFKNLSQLAKFEEAVGNNFMVAPRSRWSKGFVEKESK